MNITQHYYGEVGQVIQAEGDHYRFTMNGSKNDADRAGLVQALQNMPHLDSRKLASLKKELEALSKMKGVPFTVRVRMISLMEAVKAVEDSGKVSGGKLWEKFEPYIGDAEKLAAMGELGEKLLGILKNFVIPV